MMLKRIADAVSPKNAYVAATTTNLLAEIDQVVDQSSHAQQQKELVHAVTHELLSYGHADISKLDDELVRCIMEKHPVCIRSCCAPRTRLFDSIERIEQHRAAVLSRKRDERYNPVVGTVDDDSEATEPCEPATKKKSKATE